MKIVVGLLLGVCYFLAVEALPAANGEANDNPSKFIAALQPVVTPDVPQKLNETSRDKREQERVVFSDDTYQPCRTGTCSGGSLPVRETSCADGKCGTGVTAVRESSCPDGRCGSVRQTGSTVTTVRESSCPDGRCGSVRESSCPDGRCGTVRESGCPSGRCGSYVTYRETYQQPIVTYQQPITTYSCRGSGCGGGSYPVRESSCPSGRCGSYVSTVRETYTQPIRTYQQPITTYQQPITTYSCRGSGCGGGSYPVIESGCPSGRCGSYVTSVRESYQPITTYSCRGGGCGK